jgi:hypothetical protein
LASILDLQKMDWPLFLWPLFRWPLVRKTDWPLFRWPLVSHPVQDSQLAQESLLRHSKTSQQQQVTLKKSRYIVVVGKYIYYRKGIPAGSGSRTALLSCLKYIFGLRVP